MKHDYIDQTPTEEPMNMTIVTIVQPNLITKIFLQFMLFLNTEMTQLKSCLFKDKAPFIHDTEYHSCPYDGRFQGISSNGTDLTILEYTSFSTRRNVCQNTCIKHMDS